MCLRGSSCKRAKVKRALSRALCMKEPFHACRPLAGIVKPTLLESAPARQKAPHYAQGMPLRPSFGVSVCLLVSFLHPCIALQRWPIYRAGLALLAACRVVAQWVLNRLQWGDYVVSIRAQASH